MKKILLIGTSCSGKTTLGKKLSKALQIKFIDLDDLYWLPNWKNRGDHEFRTLVDSEIQNESWVVAGNYSAVRGILWPKADTIIWLDYPFFIVLYRAVVRSFKRAVTREKLFAGNVESFRQSFLSKKSIIVWVFKTYGDRRQRYPALLNSELTKNSEVKIFKMPGELKSFVNNLDKKA